MLHSPSDDPNIAEALPPSPRFKIPPILLWGGAWLVALSVTVSATMSLLSPGRLEPDPILLPEPVEVNPADRTLGEDDAALEVVPEIEPSPEPVPLPVPAADQDPSNVPPSPAPEAPSGSSWFSLRLLVLLTVGCATTSFVVTLILRSLSSLPATPPRPLPSARVTPLPPSRSPQFHPQTAPFTVAATPKAVAARLPQQPRVTVLAPEELTPLDEMPLPPGDSLDLADQLDIRRHYSLSALIHDSES
ncbi:hypothetical protein [Spirulina major]|uniref:hypothetical protein n=1 Tax=Spirulina major TaxID=270636 RepID=UPI000933AB73|nr:hypothetical protein [Spirulina major]